MTRYSAVVLLSGGQDSTTCLFWAKKRFRHVHALAFDYGQRHRSELEAAADIASIAGVELEVLELGVLAQLGDSSLVRSSQLAGSGGYVDEEMPEGLPTSFVPGRNLLFLGVAAAYAVKNGIKDVVTGVCETDYSVGGGSLIFVRNSGQTACVSIREFVEEWPEDDYETLSVNGTTWSLEWKAVTGRWRHEVGTKRTMRVSLERGGHIDITEDHSLFSLGDDYSIVPVAGKDLEVGMPLVVPMNFRELHGAEELGYLSLKGLSDRINSRYRIKMAEEAGNSVLWRGNVRGRVRLPIEFPCTDAFLYAVGLWIAEGSVAEGKIRFSNGVGPARERVREAFEPFGFVVSRPTNGYDYEVQGGGLLAHAFDHLDLSGSSSAGTRHLPRWFWHLSDRQKQVLLAGFWDGDGGKFHDGCAVMVQKSVELIRELDLAFRSLGAYPSLFPLPRGQEGLGLRFSSANDAQVIAAFPLLHEERLRTAQRAAEVEGRDKSRGLWKTDALWQRIRAAPTAPGVAGELYNRLGKYDNSVRGQRHPLLREVGLGHTLASPVGFQCVTSVEPLVEEVMYDLSVEGNENFIANGVLAHNSGYPDCRESFVQAMQEAVNQAMPSSAGPITIHTPLMHMDKSRTVHLASMLGDDCWRALARSITCYEGQRPGCGACPSCQLRAAGFEGAGLEDPALEGTR